jgi:site-specific DNA-adenine methylase
MVENLPATRIITKYGLPDAVLYVDPPYLETTRTGRDRPRGRDYSHDTASDDEHRELASALRATKATVLRVSFVAERGAGGGEHGAASGLGVLRSEHDR